MTAKIKQPEAVKRPDWLMHCFHGKEGKKVKKKMETSGSTAGPLQKKVGPKAWRLSISSQKLSFFFLFQYLNLLSWIPFLSYLLIDLIVIFCFAFALSFAICFQSKCPLSSLSLSTPSGFLQEDF
jgi:hypothetical protein